MLQNLGQKRPGQAVRSRHPCNASWELPWLLFQHFYLPALDKGRPNEECTGGSDTKKKTLGGGSRSLGAQLKNKTKTKWKRGALHMPRVRLGINPNLIHPAFSFVHFPSLFFPWLFLLIYVVSPFFWGVFFGGFKCSATEVERLEMGFQFCF